MKYIIILSLFTLNSSLLTLHAAIPQKWDVELTAQPPQVFTLQRPRGETYDLEAVLKNSGKPFEPAITNACIYWQTNGMENLYWSAPASVSNNVLRATWLPSMDPGATTVRGYIGDPGHIYAAAFQFRFIASPGATPNELPLPQKVIDFAKVTVLNPPWSGGSGGGGGCFDTNSVIDIIHKTVDGSARMLPPYLHYLEMDDTYPDAAAEWYAQADYSHGSCSSVRDGNTLSRNYDWNFDFMPEFVVRCVATASSPSCPTGRYASLAVCNVGTNLTEADVTSGKWSRWYKALPGHAVDGINENGVAVNINVVSGAPAWGGGVSPALHPLAAVRWILDNATNAQHGAEYIASHIAFPSGWTQNFHYMVCDQASTYIVENGTASNVTAVAAKRVMTNFPILPDAYSGMGKERYDLLYGGESITNAWYTRAYLRTTNWVSEFKDEAEMEAAKAAWETHTREELRGHGLWQTVHTSIYDLKNLTLKIAVQEQDDWYVFNVPSAGGVKPEAVREIVQPMIGAATNGLRRVEDLTVYEKVGVGDDWVWTSEDSDLLAALKENAIKPERIDSENPEMHWWYVPTQIGSWSIVGGFDTSPATSPVVEFTFDNPDASKLGVKATATRAHDFRPVSPTDFLATTKGVNAAIEANEKTGTDQQIVRGEKFWNIWYITAAFSTYAEDAGHAVSSDNAVTAARDSDGNIIADTYARRATTLSGYGITDAAPLSMISATDPTFSNEVVTVARTVTPRPSPTLRLYDEIRQCWWIGRMVNGVINWEVE